MGTIKWTNDYSPVSGSWTCSTTSSYSLTEYDPEYDPEYVYFMTKDGRIQKRRKETPEQKAERLAKKKLEAEQMEAWAEQDQMGD